MTARASELNVARAASVRPDAGHVDISMHRLPDMVTSWIRTRTPAAVVRFGEGEGRVLVASPDDEDSIRVARNKLRRQTGCDFSTIDLFAVRRSLLHAFDEADVVGIRGSERFPDEQKLWVRRIEDLFARRVAEGRPPAYLSHCLLNGVLHTELGQILRGVRRLSLISSRDLHVALSLDYDINDVRGFQVPSQYVMRGIDGDFEAPLHGVPIWPHFYHDLYSRISVREPGEVFLVGAGILGKALCIRIRDLGGIALDMGSTLDTLAGKITRGPGKPAPYRG